MVLWPIRVRLLFELFYNGSFWNKSELIIITASITHFIWIECREYLDFPKGLNNCMDGWIGILPIIHFRNNFVDEWLSIFYGNNWVLCCDVLFFKWKVINLRLVFWIKYNAREVFDIFVTQKVKKRYVLFPANCSVL